MYWKTLDNKIIPINCMTTTHLGNAMYYCDKHNLNTSKQLLLMEWNKREKEGIMRKFYRFICRNIFNYYKGDYTFDPKKYKTTKTQSFM